MRVLEDDVREAVFLVHARVSIEHASRLSRGRDEIRERAVGQSIPSARFLHRHRTFVEVKCDCAVLMITGSDAGECRQPRALPLASNYYATPDGEQQSCREGPPGTQNRAPRHALVLTGSQ